MVQRYDVAWVDELSNYDMAEDDNGDYVLYTDYQKLEAENAELRKQTK